MNQVRFFERTFVEDAYNDMRVFLKESGANPLSVAIAHEDGINGEKIILVYNPSPYE